MATFDFIPLVIPIEVIVSPSVQIPQFPTVLIVPNKFRFKKPA